MGDKFYKVLRGAFLRLELAMRTLSLRLSYALIVRRLRRRAPGAKIRVLFLVNEISKWKAQSLYDLMQRSGTYEPIMGVTLADFDRRLSEVEQQKKMKQTQTFFEAKKMPTVMMYDLVRKEVRRVDEVRADIVFYQQPYVFLEEHYPRMVSFHALTCYVPYYVNIYDMRNFDYEYDFHRELWRYFIISEDFAKGYRHGAHFWNYAGRLLGLGHTILDYYHLNKDVGLDDRMIIYAPHWSFNHPHNVNKENFSTFLHTGELILEYAKEHPDITWVFRPHPSLSFALERSGVWSNERIAGYWEEWGKIGQISTGGDYQYLFLQSRAMITDCGSFLTEYFATGKPLIHLVSQDVKVRPTRASKRYFDSFYQVKSKDELVHVLDEVIARAEDPRKEERLRVLKSSGLLDCYAAKNILEHLNSELGLK